MRGRRTQMASVTAEVLLYFGTDDKDFQRTVNEIRFSDDPSLDAQEIIELLKPIYMRGYYEGKADGVLQS